MLKRVEKRKRNAFILGDFIIELSDNKEHAQQYIGKATALIIILKKLKEKKLQYPENKKINKAAKKKQMLLLLTDSTW